MSSYNDGQHKLQNTGNTFTTYKTVIDTTALKLSY